MQNEYINHRLYFLFGMEAAILEEIKFFAEQACAEGAAQNAEDRLEEIQANLKVLRMYLGKGREADA